MHAGQVAGQEAAVAAMAEARDQIVRDLGGEAELSQVQRDMVASYLRVGLLEEFCFQKLETGGPFTASGKQRPVVATLLKAIAQRQSLANLIGLQRRAKPAQTLTDYLDGGRS